MIRVIVAGAAGRMGKTVCQAVNNDNELELVAVVDPRKEELSLDVVKGATVSEIAGQVEADVLVDFTNASAVVDNVSQAAKLDMHAVIGTTGLSDHQKEQLKEITKETGRNILLAPNFAIGAVLLIQFASQAAEFFERVEIIELHHDKKLDAPSGTAILTAELIGDKLKQTPLTEKEKVKGARGGTVNSVPIHSVRLPGLVAHQEVIFGLVGQTLTLRHDSTDRTSFMPGVLLAIKEIFNHPGFTYGLEKFLNL
jgi:4-hydroxy-tetrahydrodipicolinate reductase